MIIVSLGIKYSSCDETSELCYWPITDDM